jgi:hypothetical protein
MSGNTPFYHDYGKRKAPPVKGEAKALAVSAELLAVSAELLAVSAPNRQSKQR